ncbi:hypothetical protein [Natrinema salsiterrestre]|uniref:Uncharacterized protein n=1 Tax=Natrinema salsiterrestre TaxID=2950540 RepID=A0A9Q4Q077_9EURY|nr:hypothetical protein [Natrinema salsiterrestre]MDF9745499.1 hypothetical protein [Natrinema salsiterrestre]
MMGQTAFTVMIAVFWLAELAFGSLVVYWFVTQGFDDDSGSLSAVTPLEDRSYTMQSLAMWAAFFVILVAGILLAS